MSDYPLITGASRGIGFALARRLAQKNMPIILAARDTTALANNARALSDAFGIDVRTVSGDLSCSEGVEDLKRETAHMSISGLVNNAGFGLGGPFMQQDGKRLSDMLFLNMQALTHLTHHFLPQLVAKKGLLINVASQGAFQPMPYLAAYAASKAYVLHLTEALHYELKDKGVRVLALCPGATQTSFFERAEVDLRQTYLKAGGVEHVIDAAMAALESGRASVVPGMANKAATFGQRFLGRALVVRLSAQMLRPKC